MIATLTTIAELELKSISAIVVAVIATIAGEWFHMIATIAGLFFSYRGDRSDHMETRLK